MTRREITNATLGAIGAGLAVFGLFYVAAAIIFGA